MVEPQQSWSSENLAHEQVVELSQSLHQASQPLTVLQGYLELALVGAHSPQDYQQLLKRAWDESQRLSACFEQIRNLLWLRPSLAASDHDLASAKLRQPAMVQETQKAGSVHV